MAEVGLRVVGAFVEVDGVRVVGAIVGEDGVRVVGTFVGEDGMRVVGTFVGEAVFAVGFAVGALRLVLGENVGDVVGTGVAAAAPTLMDQIKITAKT